MRKNVIDIALKSLFFEAKITKNYPSARGSAPGPFCVTAELRRFFEAKLVQQGAEIRQLLCKKKTTFGSSPLSVSKSLVALVIAITFAGRLFKRLHGPHTKQANKHCRTYTSLFSNINIEFLK